MAVPVRAASSRLRTSHAPHEHEAPGDRRWPAASDLTLTVSRRRDSHLRFEARAERSKAREPDEITDLGHREVRGSQQLPCTLDASLGEVRPRRPPVCVPEGASEVEARVARLPREHVQVERLRVRTIHEVLRGTKVREPLDIGRGRHTRQARCGLGWQLGQK